MLILGLTGSIGMGKTTAAKMLRRLGLPYHDADDAVHSLYARGGAAVGPIGRHFPEAVVDGAVDRQRLAGRVLNDPAALKLLERIVHPLTRRASRRFLADCARRGCWAAVLAVPLLYETRLDRDCDAVLVVTAPAAVQRGRVLRRPGMTADKLRAILSRQMPDAEKRARADFVVQTGLGRRPTLAALQRVLRDLRRQPPRRWNPAWPMRRKF
ncbi:MAG TPA: dephospho-CoA kinase [Alphaproteobacteria bacterium]|nr:dephospho-CoA kinase [Alphaproteobacteria bacterium]